MKTIMIGVGDYRLCLAPDGALRSPDDQRFYKGDVLECPAVETERSWSMFE